MNQQRCFVCDNVRLCEDHHYVPQSLGGTATIPLCTSCHDAVDRMTWEKWDPGEAFVGLMQLWSALPVQGRTVALKMFSWVCQATAVLESQKSGRRR